MNETKELKIKVTEKTTKDGKKKFNTYKTFSKNGRPTEIKFRQEVSQLPKEDGHYTFNADEMDLNTSGEYPTLWIRGDYIAFRPLGELTEDEKAKKREAINDYFG